MKKILCFLTLMFALLLGFHAQTAYADELSPELTLSNQGSKNNLTDSSHYTSVKFDAKDTIQISAKDGSAIYGIYICWDSEPAAWILTTDTGELSCGTHGFLHEYVALEAPSTTLTIHIPEDSTRMDGIRIFGEGELPSDVQVWNPPCERADIMVVSSHADDEILFMGGVLPTYSYLYHADIQVVYMCEFWTTTRVREHEKLDGLWEAGIRFYPVCGNFYDHYSENVAGAKKQYDYERMTSFLTEQIRRCQPQVLVTHDIYGEYGHGFHILTCQALMDAVEFAADASYDPDSADAYGIWNTPKTYLHLFPANSIRLDLHIPLEEDYENRTALDILKAAYKKHVSQQRWRFYVSDDYEHSCADFGLYRTLVGPDTSNDLLCNLKTYAMQEEETIRLKAEAEAEELRLKAEAEAIRLKEEEAAAKKAEEERLLAEQTAKEEQERSDAERAIREELTELRERENSYLSKIQTLSQQLNKEQKKKTVLAGGFLIAFLAILTLSARLYCIHASQK